MNDVQSQATVGGRPVILTGSIMMGPSDLEATVSLENLTFVFSFLHHDDPAILSSELPQPFMLKLNIQGAIPFGGGAWHLPNIGTFHGKSLHLTLNVTAMVSLPAVVRAVHYTFTTTEIPA